MSTCGCCIYAHAAHICTFCIHSELVYGDNMNRAKLREILKANEEKIEKEEVRRKREEEGFQFDDDDFSKPSSPIKIKRS